MKVAEIGERHRSDFRAVAERCGSVFLSDEWIDAVAPTSTRYGIFDGGWRLVGGFILDTRQQLGLRVVRNPPYTPSIGPFFSTEAQNPAVVLDQRRQVAELMCHTVLDLHPAVVATTLERGWSDALPFIWRGFKATTAYTYTINLGLNEDTIWHRLASDRRKSIRKAKRDNLEVSPTEDVDAVVGLAVGALERRNVRSYPDALRRLAHSIASCGRGRSWVACESGRTVAGVMCVHDTTRAYYVCGGVDPARNHHGAVASCLWAAIRWAKELGLELFDFEGSSVPGVERFFRGFGGRLETVVRLTRAWLPIEIALKLRHRAQF